MTFGAVLRGSVALAAAWPSTALAQNALPDEPIAAEEDQAEEIAPGDIVITANCTASLLSKTPIAPTAVSGESLIQAGITNPTQLEETVPNLSIARSNGLQITIRSVTSTDNTEKGDASAAFMVNGIYIARAQSQEVSFYDIERVGMLRGPQGTLDGCNSTAVVVNILTAEPKFDFGARGDIVYGSFDALNVTAMLNLPVSDKIALRIAGNLDQRDSFLIDGRPNDGISFDRFKEDKSIRVLALFEPTEDLSLLLVGDYSTIKDKTANSVPQAQETPRDNNDFGIMSELNYSFEDVTLTYLGSYREFQRREFQTAINGLVGAYLRGDYWQTSHKARLAYGNGGPLQVQAGAFYFRDEPGIALFLNDLVGRNTRFGFLQSSTISEKKSVFGQATYELAEGLRLTGGIRYSVDDKSRIGQTVIDRFSAVVNSGNIGNFLGRIVTQNNNAARTFKEVTWRAGVDYDTSLGLFFASVSTGYKAGGFNDGCEVSTTPGCTLPESALLYDPETLTAYEGGFKFRIGQPGPVMCAYNRVLGEQACASDYLLNQVLKRDWGLKGFVMSDWGAVPNVEAALKGLDQQSGEQLDPAVFFDAKTLGALAKTDKRYAARLDDMNRRILWAIYNNELDKNPAQPGRKVDFAAHGAVAEEIARQGIVLLRNRDRALPLVGSAKTILVIGGYADTGVLSGAGSSQAHG